MSTTVSFAEIFIIGLQAVVWVALFAAALFGVRWADLDALKAWEASATLIFLGLTYTLGLLADRLADALFSPLDHRIRPSTIPDKEAPVWRMRLYIITQDNGMTKFVEFARSRIRIVRATAFNLLVFALAFVVYRIARGLAIFNAATLGGLALALLGIALSFYAWRRMTKAYYKRLSQAYSVDAAQANGELPPMNPE
ncbi:MAG: hypothetical protein ACM3QS_05265 [Bacteroidota bacterium]